MRFSSKTGLLPSVPKKLLRIDRTKKIDLIADARPAPFVLKPLAGLYNPYRYGCSLLCNHPADEDARELLRRAKDTWTNEGKRAILFEDEITAIRDSLEQLQIYSKHDNENIPMVEAVPEELFRRFTDTDSRPLTPAPTLSSAATKASGSRRCVTPDPISISTVKEKTMLVLDLRRSHSQEMICGGTSFLDPPLILIQQVPTRRGSLENISSTKKSTYTLHMPATARISKTQKDSTSKSEASTDCQVNGNKTETEDNEEVYIKRRGKKRRKQRHGSTALPVQTSTDPETQVGTVGPDSHNPSARHSLAPGSAEDEALQKIATQNADDTRKSSGVYNVPSFLDIDVLKLLRRELNDEIYDNEFDWKRRIALAEALKTISDEKSPCEELIAIQEELNLPPLNTDLWISIPRVFSRANARFELPPFSDMLQTMTPMEYIRDNVDVTDKRKIMYNSIFNKFKVSQTERERRILGKDIMEGLHLLMGKNLPMKPLEAFKELVGWNTDELYDFKTFSCICATCERLLASEYTKHVPDRETDPCHELEAADFEALNTILQGQHADERLIKILYGIKNF